MNKSSRNYFPAPLKRKAFKLTFAALALVFSSLSASAAYNYYWWSRGDSETTSNNLFKDDGKLSERVVYGGSTYTQSSTATLKTSGYFDSSGYITSSAPYEEYFNRDTSTSTYNALVLGYYYSQYAGAGSTASLMNLNQNLTIDKVYFQNLKSLDDTGTWTSTAGMTGNGTLTLDNAAATSNYLQILNTSYGFKGKARFSLVMDVNMQVNLNFTAAWASVFTLHNSYSTFGSAENNRTINISNRTGYTSGYQVRLFNTSYAADHRSYTNVYSTINSSYTGELDFYGNYNNDSLSTVEGTRYNALYNIWGNSSNVFNGNIGIRVGIVNLKKSGGAAAISWNTSKTGTFQFGFSESGIVNIFGEGQLVTYNTKNYADLAMWAPRTTKDGLRLAKVGTLNLNGTSIAFRNVVRSAEVKDPYRYILVDFGIESSGLTTDDKNESGISESEMHYKGEGYAQVFRVEGTMASDTYLVLKNYIVGEDRVLTKNKARFSATVFDDNFFRFDVGDDTLVYGTDYWFTETSGVSYNGGTYYEYSVAYIPEASEVALAFGAIALMVALIRRRKA